MNISKNHIMKCIFCEIIEKNKSKDKIIVENDSGIVILDINPISRGHCLLITKKHFENIHELDQNTWNDFLFLIQETIDYLKKTFSPKGFNFLNNMGKIAFQEIFHFHLHIIPKYRKEEGFEILIKKTENINIDIDKTF